MTLQLYTLDDRAPLRSGLEERCHDVLSGRI
jgi:hypothetical protein